MHRFAAASQRHRTETQTETHIQHLGHGITLIRIVTITTRSVETCVRFDGNDGFDDTPHQTAAQPRPLTPRGLDSSAGFPLLLAGADMALPCLAGGRN